MAKILAILLLLTAARSADDDAEGLKDRFQALIAAKGNKVQVAVAFHDLETGEECLIEPDRIYHAASTMKVPVLMEVYRQASAGEFALDAKVRVKNEFASIVDGSLYHLDPKDDSELSLYDKVGQDVTIRELARLMITESSNLATNLLNDRVSAGSTTALMVKLGAKDVKVLRGVEDSLAFAKGLNNVTTARGLMLLLTGLAERKVVSESASNEMLGVLRGQKFREGIPSGLPPGVIVAHKTGSIRSAYHDAAVVEIPDRKPFVLVILTRGFDDEKDAHKIVASIARAAYEHITLRKDTR